MKKDKFLEISPMLLEEVNKPFNDNNYIYEIKFDGIRTLIYIDNKEIIIKSRNNTILNDYFPELLNIKNINNSQCVFDGEIIAMENGKPSFSKLQERIKLKDKKKLTNIIKNNPVIFVCFDILYKDKDLTNLSLLKRKDILNKIKDSDIFIKSKYFENNGVKLFQKIKEKDLEGIIAKKKNSLYTFNKRTDDWLKIKNYKIEDFYICGYLDNLDKHVISIILGEKINNKYFFVGKAMLSKKNKLYEKIKKEKILKKSILENYNNNKYKFINFKYKVKIQYLERTKNNYLRQPFIKNN